MCLASPLLCGQDPPPGASWKLEGGLPCSWVACPPLSHLPGERLTGPLWPGVSWPGCYPGSSLITMGSSLLDQEASLIWVIKHLFEFSPESAVIITIKQTWNREAFIPAAQSSQSTNFNYVSSPSFLFLKGKLRQKGVRCLA